MSLTAEVDWPGTDTFESLNADVISVETSRGRDYASQLTGRSAAGQCTISLRNIDGKYSSFNAASPLFGLIKPRRKVRISVGSSAEVDAALFTAANSEYLSIADNAALSVGANALDICAWVYLNSLPAANTNVIIAAKSNAANPSSSDEYALRIRNAAGTIRFVFSARALDNASTSSVAADTFGAPSIGTWYFVHAYFDPNSVEIGISVNDGAHNTTSAADAGIFDGTRAFHLGAASTPGSYFDGRMLAVGIWKHATVNLTATELTYLYNSGSSRQYSALGTTGTDGEDLLNNLVAWWALDEASGTRDDADGANNLTDNNTVTSIASGLSPATVSTVLWTGFLDRIEPQTGSIPTATLYAYGALATLAGPNAKVEPPALVAELTGTVIDEILDAANWPAADRDLDAGAVPTGHVYFPETEALAAIRQVEDTEQGFICEGIAWDVCFHDRYNRAMNHTTSLATFTDSIAGPLHYLGVDQSDPLREIFNEVEVEVPRHETGGLQVLWSLTGGTLTLTAGETRTYIAVPGNVGNSTVAYVSEWTTPVVGTDLVQTGVANGDIAVAVVKAARTMQVAITNNHGSATALFSLVQARGIPVIRYDDFRVRAFDAASQADYQRRLYPFPSNLYGAAPYAQAAAEYIVRQRKDEHPVLTLGLVAYDAAMQTQQITRDINDRITVEATEFHTQLGLAQDFYIEAIHHRLSVPGLLETAFELSPVLDEDDLFLMDDSLLDGADVLAY